MINNDTARQIAALTESLTQQMSALPLCITRRGHCVKSTGGLE